MLHHEHMDSGTFKLELAVTPLLNVFAGRLEVYKYMALKKCINLRIEDQAEASEYYVSARDSVVAAETAVLSSTPVLYIDRFRVEQVIRNLMSNAIKFTPKGGDITMRIARVSAASPATTVGSPPRDEVSPIDKLVPGQESRLVPSLRSGGQRSRYSSNYSNTITG